MATCKKCGNEIPSHMAKRGTCNACNLAAVQAEWSTKSVPARRESETMVGSTKYTAGEFVIIGAQVRDQKILVALHESVWQRANYEANMDAGYYTSFAAPTDEEKQQPEYQRLALQLAADQAHEEEMTARAQRSSEDSEVRAMRAELDAQEGEEQRQTKYAKDVQAGELVQVNVGGYQEVERVETSGNYTTIFLKDKQAGAGHYDLPVAGNQVFANRAPVKIRSNRGGARPGAGGGKDQGKGQGPAYQQGYQAGYKAGMRARDK